VIYTKFHYYMLHFYVGHNPKRTTVKQGDDYGLRIKAEDLHDVQAYIEQEFAAINITLKAETVETAALTTVEKASLVIEQL
jgi:hypothetical protein